MSQLPHAEAALAPGTRSGEALPRAVARTELLLTGSSGDELVAAIARWASERWETASVQLWVNDERGFRLFARAGAGGDDGDTDLARRCSIEGARERVGVRLCVPVAQAGGHSAVLLLRFARALPVEAEEALVQAAALLELRLPAALELERLHEAVTQLAAAERLQHALYAITELAGSDSETDQVLARMHAIVAELMYAENFFIALLDRTGERMRFAYFQDSEDTDPPAPQQFFPIEEFQGSLTAHVVATGENLMGPSETLVAQVGAKAEGFGPQSVDWLGVPLTAGGEVLGAVVVQSYIEHQRYTEKDRALLTFVAQHIATTLQRRRAHDELELRVSERTDELREANRALLAEVDERQRGEQLQAALFRIAELGSAGGSLEEFYAAVHRVVGRLLYAENFYIALLTGNGREIEFPYSVDQKDPRRVRRALGRGMTEYVLRSGQPVLADDAVHERLSVSGEVITHGAQADYWLGVPLVCESGTVGVLAVQSYGQLHRYTRRDQEILTFVSYHIANALERKRAADRLREANAELERRVAERTEALFAANRDLRQQIAERERFERQLQFAASHDALTGLPNRASFLQRMAEAMTAYRDDPQRRFAVLFLDLDRFKVINDSVGHLIGDDLLKEAGSRIAGVVGDAGLVARLGGDEFAVLLDPLRRDGEAVELAERIIGTLDEPIRAGGKELFTSTSIGITVARSHYSNPEELLRDADVALYRAKGRGRRCHEMFDEDLRRQALHRLEQEGNLRRALVRHEFEPVFQPILALDRTAVSGYEALMRWRQPNGELLAPGAFLATAEESGLAEALDWQMYELVFAQGWALIESGLYISINVGARHFRNPNFISELLKLLDRYEFPPTRLRVEVTERTLLDDPEQIRELLLELRGHGIKLALDDFGTGYSSLSYLHQFPLDVLKVDRSFVLALDSSSGGNAQAVLRAVCTLGLSLGMEVVAEGIETPRQLEILRRLGCGFGQGYLFSRPQPLSELIAAMAAAEVE